METMGIVAMYIGLAAAVVAGVALVWCLIEEFVGFESVSHRPRSSRVEAMGGPDVVPITLPLSPAPAAKRAKAGGVGPVHGALH